MSGVFIVIVLVASVAGFLVPCAYSIGFDRGWWAHRAENPPPIDPEGET